MSVPGINVDRGEVGKFDSLASRFWDVRGEFRPLHILNPVRAQFVLDRVSIAGANVLDVGCGGGLLCEALARAGGKVTGCDLAPGMIEVARLHAAEQGLDICYRVASAEELAGASAGSFDVVTCMEMLEHVPRPGAIVEACKNLVKPGGWVFFSTLNRNVKSYLFAVLGAEYIARMLPKGTHDYARFIRPSELASFVRDAGLRTADIKGIAYNPLSKHFALSSDTSVNYLLACRRDA
jgi:2-polyprenyl-6-hydroxyphenyl methylase / 3-demethylubiquinone-9 3-methyltransferase